MSIVLNNMTVTPPRNGVRTFKYLHSVITAAGSYFQFSLSEGDYKSAWDAAFPTGKTTRPQGTNAVDDVLKLLEEKMDDPRVVGLLVVDLLAHALYKGVLPGGIAESLDEWLLACRNDLPEQLRSDTRPRCLDAGDGLCYLISVAVYLLASGIAFCQATSPTLLSSHVSDASLKPRLARLVRANQELARLLLRAGMGKAAPAARIIARGGPVFKPVPRFSTPVNSRPRQDTPCAPSRDRRRDMVSYDNPVFSDSTPTKPGQRPADPPTRRPADSTLVKDARRSLMQAFDEPTRRNRAAIDIARARIDAMCRDLHL